MPNEKYASTPVLSKVKLGNTTYYLKDADARAIIDTIFGDYLTSSDKTELQGYITALETAVGSSSDQASAAGSLYARLAQEIIDRGTAVSNETSAREAADTALSNRIDAIVSAAIQQNEKILSLDDNNKLKSTLSIAIEKQNNVDYIILKGINNAEVAKVDASAFVADGMVDSVTLTTSEGHTYIHIVFNTAAGKNPIDLDVTTLIDIYTAGDGLTVANNVFSIDLDDTSESFLTVGEDGLKLSGIQDAINDGRDAAKSYADTQVGAEETRAETAEGALGTRIAVFEADGAHDVAALETSVSGLATRVGTAEGKITTLEGKPANSITSTQITNWDNEVGAKALIGSSSDQAGASTVYGAIKEAEASAKDYADGKVVQSAGAHTHSVTASGSITPNLTPTEKYLTASAAGVALNPTSENKFITAVDVSTQGLAVASYVNSVGKVSKSVSDWTISTDTTDTECLVFTPTTVSWDGVGTIGTANAATGALANDAGLEQVAVGLGTPTTAAALTAVAVSAQPTITLSVASATSEGAVKYLEGVAGASTSVSVEGTAAEAGAHEHTIANGTPSQGE